MKLLIGLIFAGSLFAAAPVFVSATTVQSHGCVKVSATFTNLTGSTSATATLGWGTTTALGFSTPFYDPYTATDTWTLATCGLAPSTSYYIRVTATNIDGSAISSCADAATGTTWTCEAGGGKLIITTGALPADHGGGITMPTSVPSSAYRAITGSTLTVASNCSNLQTQINACAALDQSLVHQVTIPVGTICTDQYTLPVKTGGGADTGECVIRSAASDSALPPAGTQITLDYTPYVAIFRTPYTRAGVGNTFNISSVSGANGYRLGPGLYFDLETNPVPVKISICGVEEGFEYYHGNTGTLITTCTPHGLSYLQTVSVAEVQGFSGHGPNGTWFVQYVPSPTSLFVAGSYNWVTGYPTFQCGSPPCWTNGTGYLIRSTGTAISAITNATPPVITTTTEHGLSNFETNAISSISGSVITLAGGHTMANINEDSSVIVAVQISGSSVSAYNGLWAKASLTGNTFTIVGGPASSCGASCGTIRYKNALRIEGVTGALNANGNHIYTVIDGTHLSLDTATASGPYITGGVIATDPDSYGYFMTLVYGSNRITLDRVYMAGAEWPSRQLYGVNFASNDSVITGSQILDQKSWNILNPTTTKVERNLKSYVESTSLFITQGHRQLVENSVFSCAGICVFTEEWVAETKADFTFRRNTVTGLVYDIAGHALSNGKYFLNRQRFELKQGKRFDIDANVFENNAQDTTPCGSAILFSPRAYYSNGMNANIKITNNTFRHVGTGIQIGSQDSSRPTEYPNQKFYINNNLLYDVNLWTWHSTPSLLGTPGVCGYAFEATGPFEDLTISHNTALDVRGLQTMFLSSRYGRSEGVFVRDNIFTANMDNNHGPMMVAADFGVTDGIVPATSGTSKQVWDAVYTGSDFSANIIIPGVRNSSTSVNYDSTSGATTYDQPACAAFFSGYPVTTCIGNGAGGDTANQREDLLGFVDKARNNYDLTLASPYRISAGDKRQAGYDALALDVAQGTLRNVRTYTGATPTTQIHVAWTSAAACTVEYGTGALGTGTRVAVAAPADLEGTTLLTGLTTATLYHYWVICPTITHEGEFRTR